MNQDFLTVSQLNNYIKDVVSAGFPQPLWICGEIQGLERNRGKKHVFFELVEKDPASQEIISRIGLVIFANRKAHIEAVLKQAENAFELRDDIEVKFSCQVDFYVPHGAMRLVVENIDPTHTLGKLAQQRQKLIALLKEKGVLDQNKKLELPLVPLKVGLITSDDSAAYNDFISEIKKSGYSFKIYLRNSIMQGKSTEADVCKAIDELNHLPNLDVIVITRGGGSIADLSCFDSQKIAEKIAGSRLPVLSGIGHEINTTITDLAAHTFAKTPTAIAQFLVSRIQEFLTALDEAGKSIMEESLSRIEGEREKIKSFAFGLQNFTGSYFRGHNAQLIRLTEALKQRPVNLLKDRMKGLSQQEEAVQRAIKLRFQQENLKLRGYEKIVDFVHPINTMKRGFSVTRSSDGKIIRHVKDIKPNQLIKTEVVDGVIESKAVADPKKQEGFLFEM
jgi:exodeoxyribonuclease VII large subunit